MNGRNQVLLSVMVNEAVANDDSDCSRDELLFAVAIASRRKRKPRLQRFCEMIVLLLSDADFKSHFL